MPRGHAYLWTPALLVGEVVTSLVIALACAVMAVIFARARRRGSLALALAAGGLAAAHVLDAWVVWHPAYGVDLVVRGATAVAAVAAAVSAAAPAARQAGARRARRPWRSLNTDSWTGWRWPTLVRRREVTPAELIEEAIARAERVNPRIGAIVTPLTIGAAQGSRHGGDRRPVRRRAAAAQGSRRRAGRRAPGGGVAPADRLRAGARLDHRRALPPRRRRHRSARPTTPELGLVPYTEPKALRPDAQPVEPRAHAGRLQRRRGGGRRGRHRAAGARQRRRRLDPHPGVVLRPLRAEAVARPHARRPRPQQLWSGLAIAARVSRSVRDSAALLDAIAGPEPTAPYCAPPAARPFLDEVGAPPGRLRIALSKRGVAAAIPPHPDCVAAADDAARLLADLGHHVEEADMQVDGDEFARDFFLHACSRSPPSSPASSRRAAAAPRRDELETVTAIAAIWAGSAGGRAALRARPPGRGRAPGGGLVRGLRRRAVPDAGAAAGAARRARPRAAPRRSRRNGGRAAPGVPAAAARRINASVGACSGSCRSRRWPT